MANGLIINNEELPKFINELGSRYLVFAPVKRDGITSFREIRSFDEVDLDSKSNVPPKQILFPRCETLFTYKLSNKNVELQEPQIKDEKIVLFGVAPCDALGFTLIDDVLFSDGLQDTSYLHKRENTIIIAKSCNHPDSSCFCTSLGGSPSGREGSDLLLQEICGRYLLEAVSQKGEKIIDEIRGFTCATQADFEEARNASKIAEESVRTKLKLQGIGEKLEGMFDNKLWQDISQKCVGCGVCTFLCPTCYCFDIVDESNGNKGKRVRAWDSCQFPLFTMQGSGVNPRPTGKERMRQRIMHKFNYNPKNYGAIACVGCGRCIRECPVSLDIRDILEKIVKD